MRTIEIKEGDLVRIKAATKHPNDLDTVGTVICTRFHHVYEIHFWHSSLSACVHHFDVELLVAYEDCAQ